ARGEARGLTVRQIADPARRRPWRTWPAPQPSLWGTATHEGRNAVDAAPAGEEAEVGHLTRRDHVVPRLVDNRVRASGLAGPSAPDLGDPLTVREAQPHGPTGCAAAAGVR